MALPFSIAYSGSEEERKKERAGAINAFTFGIGCISDAAAPPHLLFHSSSLSLFHFVCAAAFLLILQIY